MAVPGSKLTNQQVHEIIIEKIPWSRSNFANEHTDPDVWLVRKRDNTSTRLGRICASDFSRKSEGATNLPISAAVDIDIDHQEWHPST